MPSYRRFGRRPDIAASYKKTCSRGVTTRRDREVVEDSAARVAHSPNATNGYRLASMRHIAPILVLAAAMSGSPLAGQQRIQTYRPFGDLRAQAAEQQRWLDQRMKTVLPALMKKHGVDMWVIPMREYNEDPVFSSIVSPTTFAARRRTIYLFYDPCAGVRGDCAKPFERLAMGGTSQGGVFTAIRSTKAPSGPAGGSGASAGRAVGRRTVAGAQDGDRKAKSEDHRHRRVTRLRVQRRSLVRRAGRNAQGARPAR